MQMMDHAEYPDYQSELKYLTTNTERLAHIAKMISNMKTDGNTLVLVDRIEAGKILQVELSSLNSLLTDKPEVVFVNGAVGNTDRKDHYTEFTSGDGNILIATYGVAAVGINLVRIHNLVLIEPGKSFVRVIQSIGRGLRKGFDKDFVNIYDITSSCKFAKRHLTVRKKYYTEANYEYSIEKINWKDK
jgi:superfamily II DNA or RNA helicase